MTLLVLTLYCLACFCAGAITLKLIGLTQGKRGLAFTSSAFLLGQGVLAAAWVPVGLAGWLSLPVVGSAVLALSVLGVVTGREILRTAWKDVTDAFQWLNHADRPFQAVCVLLFLAAIVFLLNAGLRAPWEDAEAFYLTYPKVIADAGRLVVMPGSYGSFSQIGLLAEFHFAALMVLDGVVAAKLFVWPTAIAAGIELAALSAIGGVGWRGRWIAIAILFTSTGFTNHIWDGKVDIFAAAFGLAAIRWILVEPHFGAAAIRCAGLLAGFASVAKFSYIPTLLPGAALLIAWQAWRNDSNTTKLSRYRRVLAWGSAFALSMALAWIPHGIKNGVLFGAPLAPFLGGDGAMLSQVWFAPEDTLWILLTYPLALTFGRYPLQGGNLSFVLLAFLPLAVYLFRAPSDWLRSPLAMITLAGLLGVVVWMVLRPSVIAPRYFFASLALLIPLVARAAEIAYEQEERPRWLRAAMVFTLVSALSFVSLPLVMTPYWSLGAKPGANPACTYASNYCQPLTKLNEIAPPGSRVYFAGYYGFWLRPDLLQCQATPAEIQRLEKLPDAAARWSYLVERGFRYVVIDKTSHARVAKRLSGETAVKITVPIPVTAQLIVGQLEPGDQRLGPAAHCASNPDGGWMIVEGR